MPIEVLESAPDKLLTTVEKVKLTLGMTGETNDVILSDMIAAASSFVERYTGRDFALQLVKESLPGKGLPDLILSLTPIIEVDKVELDDVEIDDWVLLDREAGFIQRRSGFQSTNLTHGTINRFPSNYYENRWHVTYSGGYVLPGWGSSQGTRTLPHDLERAVIDMVRSQFSTRKFDGTMKSYKIGDTQITWDRALAGEADVSGLVPKSALAVLNYYRRPF